MTLKQDIELGKASTLCNIGDGVEEFDVEIQEISLNQKEVNKSFIIHVTDPKPLFFAEFFLISASVPL